MMNIKTRLQGIAQRFSYAARHLFARTGRQVNVAGLALDILTQREQRNELPWLTPQRAVELYEAWRRGELADVQRVWEQLEETDDTLMTVLDKRQRALEDMPWAILTDAEAIGDDAERARKAELQQTYLRTVFNAVENLEDALVHLGMADFRGVAALEITGNMQRMRWEVIEPWCLARPVRRGPWMYNAKADVTFSTLEEMEKERIIVREARPIDLACMFLIVDKMHAIHGWDAFLDVFGNPSIFLELPQATNEQMAKVYDALAKRIIGDGRGTVPSGSKFQTVETRQNNCDSFEKRAKWCADAIITVATGGLLTVKAESGSGTLAGNAHADSFENLVAGSAASISATINKQFTRRLLAEAFPNDPPLAYFSLAPEPADERMRLAQLLATLKTAGWQPTQEKVAELMQMEVEPVPAAPTTAPDESAQPHTQPLVNRSSGLQPAEDTDTAEPPLNEGELEALRFLGGGLNPEQVAADAAFMAEAMRESTIDPSTPQSGYAEAGELRSTKSDNAALRADGEEENMEESGSESPAESVTNAAVRVFKRDNLGRFAVTGAVLKKNKGGRSSKGNPKRLRIKSNTPLKAARLAKPQAQVDATEHALKTREGGGGVVKGAAWVKGKRLDVKGGSSDTGGASHMTKHYKPGDTSRRKAAKDTILGRKQKDRTEVASVGKKNKVILADKGDHLEPVTTRRKTDND